MALGCGSAQLQLVACERHAQRCDHHPLGAGFDPAGHQGGDAQPLGDLHRTGGVIGRQVQGKARAHVQRAVGLVVVQAALALELGDHVRITGWPSQGPASTLDLIVEGSKETQTEKSWEIEFKTAPAQLFYAWILGNATYGQLGSTTRLYF